MKILITLFMILLMACSPVEEETTEVEKIFDPRVPGGTLLSDPVTQDVLGLSAEVQYDRVELEWISPSIYEGKDFNIYVFKTDGGVDDFELPDPNLRFSSAFLYYVRNDFEPIQTAGYVDINDPENLQVVVGQTYTYHIFIELDGVYSEGKTVTVTIPEREELIDIPNASEFWSLYEAKVGNAPDPFTGDIFLDTLNPGAPTLDRLNGQMAFAKNGMVLIITDTQHSRVLLYANRQGLSCYNDFDEDTVEFDLCLAVNASAPYSPYAVLGQPDFQSSWTCGEAGTPMDNDECFTEPTGVLVIEDETILVSDAAEGRVVIYDTFPEFGCYNFDNMLGNDTPIQCSFSRVIGKQGTSDLTTYNLATDGDAALCSPNGMDVHNNFLYIADTCNGRVVTVTNVTFPSLFSCDAGSWRTSQCVFSGVLGQPDFFTYERFRDEYDAANITYDFVASETVGNDNYLRRHFDNPIDIEITSEEDLIIVSNENFFEPSAFGNLTLYVRLVIYNSFVLEGTFPDCTPLTYATGGCDADRAIGQPEFNRLIMTPFSGQYTDTNYAMRSHGGIDSFGRILFMNDAGANMVNIWGDYTDDTIFAGPPLARVLNPEGMWDAERSRANPDLNGLGGVIYSQQRDSVFIMDAGNNSYYSVRVGDL